MSRDSGHRDRANRSGARPGSELVETPRWGVERQPSLHDQEGMWGAVAACPWDTSSGPPATNDGIEEKGPRTLSRELDIEEGLREGRAREAGQQGHVQEQQLVPGCGLWTRVWSGPQQHRVRGMTDRDILASQRQETALAGSRLGEEGAPSSKGRGHGGQRLDVCLGGPALRRAPVQATLSGWTLCKAVRSGTEPGRVSLGSQRLLCELTTDLIDGAGWRPLLSRLRGRGYCWALLLGSGLLL